MGGHMNDLYCSIGVDWMFDHSLTVEWEQWDGDNGVTFAMSEHGSFPPIITLLLAEGTVDESHELPLSQWAVALREDRYVETLAAPTTLPRRKDWRMRVQPGRPASTRKGRT